MEKTLFEVLQRVSVSCKDDGQRWTDKTRLLVLEQMLEFSGYQCINNSNKYLANGNELYLMFAKTELLPNTKYVVISTHIDTVMTEFFASRIDNGLVHGTFDNALTNAGTVYNMLRGGFSDNVIIAFTGGEESTMQGAKDVASFFSNNGIDVLAYVVLDVTWEEYVGNTFTIENVSLCNQKRNTLKDVCAELPYPHRFVEPYAFDDESKIYKNAGCFSLCIPIMDDRFMHDNVGCRVEESTFEGYTNALQSIANSLAK